MVGNKPLANPKWHCQRDVISSPPFNSPWLCFVWGSKLILSGANDKGDRQGTLGKQ